jgi:hypothetical protein
MMAGQPLISADAANTKGYDGPFLLYYGGASAASIAVSTAHGTTLVFDNVQPGSILPVGVTKVRSTGTVTAVAGDIICLVGRNGF